MLEAKQTITRDLIFKAADQIADEGRVPTIEGVKELLADWTGGKGGSYATLSPAIRDWKAKKREGESGAKDLPPLNLGDQIADMASKIWGDAVEAANSRFALELEEVKQARSETEAALAEAEAMIGKLEGRLEASEAEAISEREKATTQAATIDELRRQIEQIRADAAERLAAADATAQREREAAEAARTELAKAQLRLESMPRLEKDLEDARNEARTNASRAGEAERKLAGAEASLSAATADLARERSALDALQLEVKEIRAGKEKAEKVAAGLETVIGRLETKLELAEKQIEQHEQQPKTVVVSDHFEVDLEEFTTAGEAQAVEVDGLEAAKSEKPSKK